MIRGQPRPVRCAEATNVARPALPPAVWMLLVLVLMPLAVIGFAWAAYYVVRAAAVVLVIGQAVLQ